MILLEIILLFFLLPSICLQFLLKKDFNKLVSQYFLLLISYGIAPLISGLLFYYLIFFLPQKDNIFYIFIIFLFWFVMILYSRGKFQEIIKIYKDILKKVRKDFFTKKTSMYAIVFLFTFVFSVQALMYPISENDSAFYFSQSEALFQSKDARWYESGSIILDGINSYFYNKMIRPGIPSTAAFSFMLGSKDDSYLLFNFIFVFYYYLLLGLFLLVVARFVVSLGGEKDLPILLAFLFFVFYWNMTRFYIFDNKEVIIYFFTLAGIYLIYDLILISNRSRKIELLLGMILGLNAFVNFHGILVGIFSLFVLFIFSKLSFWQRIRQVVFIFFVNLFFSVFEFVQSFGFIFLSTYGNSLDFFKQLIVLLYNKGNVFINATVNSSSNVISSKLADQSVGGNNVVNAALSGDQKMEMMHAQMYQVNNFKDVYLKGKFQMVTNIGSYGFYFLFSMLVAVLKFKKIAASVFGRIILVFMVVYYFVVIDPLNLNKNDLAIVLWGSPKYSMLVVLFSIILVAVYFDSIARAVFDHIYKKKLLIFWSSLIIATLFYFFKAKVVNLGLGILMGLIQISRDVIFYANKVEIFYYAIFAGVIFLGISMLVFQFMGTPKKIAYKFFFTLCLFFMIAPFFIVNVGKVPLNETFTFLNSSREIKLENVIYFGDLFKVYYYAKNILPKDTTIQTDFVEIFTYNDYFKLVKVDDLRAKYKITNNCLIDEELYRAGSFALCCNKHSL